MTPKAGPFNLSSTVSACFHFAKHTEIVYQNRQLRAQTQYASYEIQYSVWSKFQVREKLEEKQRGRGKKMMAK
jgi:hypothetical protein